MGSPFFWYVRKKTMFMPSCAGSSCGTQLTWTTNGYEEIPTADVYSRATVVPVVSGWPPAVTAVVPQVVVAAPTAVVAPTFGAPATPVIPMWVAPLAAMPAAPSVVVQHRVQHRVEAGCVIDRMSQVCDAMDSAAQGVCLERMRDANLRGLNRMGAPANDVEQIADQSLAGCAVVTTAHDVW
jgi:hypothetical protein